jgi:hypothetical protein
MPCMFITEARSSSHFARLERLLATVSQLNPHGQSDKHATSQVFEACNRSSHVPLEVVRKWRLPRYIQTK